MTIHATALAINGRAVMLRGSSGAGKSDLALRLLTMPQDALRTFGVASCDVRLIADDRVCVEQVDGRIIVRTPTALHGKLEVRGFGIVDGIAICEMAPLALVVDLVAAGHVERLPEVERVTILDVAVPYLRFAPFEATTPLKIALALVARPTPSAPHPSE